MIAKKKITAFCLATVISLGILQVSVSKVLWTRRIVWLRVCFVSSYPPNHARLSEYAQNLVTALAGRPAIDALYLLVDKTTLSGKVLPEDPKVKVFRVWKADNLPSVLSLMYYILKLRPDVVHFNVSFQSFGKNKLTNVTGLSLILLSRLLGFRVLAAVHTLGRKSRFREI